jgi:hypothetical protein
MAIGNCIACSILATGYDKFLSSALVDDRASYYIAGAQKIRLLHRACNRNISIALDSIFPIMGDEYKEKLN